MTDQRWVEDLMGPAAFERLASELTGAELQSLLLRVMQRRARSRQPSEVLAQYERDPFCAPAQANLRRSLAIDVCLLAAASEFEAIELSPVAPLGTCSAVALTDQNRVLSALRGTEVVSDPTNVMALECAVRLRADPRSPVHLATSQRVLRAQPLPKLPGYAQHFRIFTLASAGAETKDNGFTRGALELHIRSMLRGLDELEREGYSFGQRRVTVLARPERERIGARLVAALGGAARLEPLEHPYYSGGLRYQIWVTSPAGHESPLIDGGTFDWVAKLTSNRRAVYVASGAGAQLIALAFRAVPGEGRSTDAAIG